MRKTLLLTLLAALLLCGGCAATGMNRPSVSTELPGVSAVLPEASAPESTQSTQAVTLYFRYRQEPYLAQETRTVTLSADQPFELVLLRELLSGPGTRSPELTTLFPEGTRVISTVSQGRTLFVTLSKEVMNGYSDEPADWALDAAWSTEVPLRRKLCMQSLIATVTENCDADRVQILVDQSALGAEGMRLRQAYYLLGEDGDTPAAPLTRQEELLLSPATTLRVILEAWKCQDWNRLYLYVASRDPQTGRERSAYQDFVTAMENLPRLTGYGFSGGSVDTEDARVTYTLHAILLGEDGLAGEADGRILRLCREGGLWKISMEQLTGWLEE